MIDINFEMDPGRLPKMPFDTAGLIDSKAAEWIEPIIEQAHREGWATPKLEREIRRYGDPAPAEIKKKFNIRGNAAVGVGYLDALTAEGLSHPMEAASELAYRNFMIRIIRKTVIEARATSSVDRWELLVTEPVAEYGCRAARLLRGKIIKRAELPELPLQGCDRRCGCTYVAKS